MKTINNKIKPFLILIFLLCLILVFFFDVLFQGKTLFTGDNISLTIPGKFLLRSFIDNREFPLWDPYLFSGMPYLADISIGVFAPVNILYLLFSPFRAHTLNVVIALWLTGIFMYMYCRVLKIPRIPALVSSIVFMFSGSVFINSLNTSILNVVMWLPLCMWSLELYLQKNKFSYGLLTSSICALQFFSGHIQYTYYTWLLIVMYTFWKTKPFSVVVVTKRLLTIYLPLILLTAIQLVPFLEYTQFSIRSQQNFAFSAGQNSILSFIRLVLPNFFGILKDGTSWGATADISGFIGIVPLLLIILLIKSRKTTSNVLFYLYISALSLSIAIGKYSPVYLFAYYVLPFYSRFRSPGTILIVYTFSLAVVTGFAVWYIFKNINQQNAKLTKLFKNCILFIFPLFIISLISKFFGFSYLLEFINQIQHIHKTSFFTRFLEYSNYRMYMIYNLWVNNIIFNVSFLLLFFLVIYYAYKQRKFTPFTKIIFVLLISSEMMLYAGNIHISAKDELLKPSSIINTILKKDTSLFRIATLQDVAKKPAFGNPDYFIQEAVKAMTFMQSNTNIFYSIQSVNGYASIVYKPYAMYVMNQKPTDPTSIEILSSSFDKFDDLNIKYVLTTETFLKELRNNLKFKLIFTYYHPFLKKNFYVFQNTQVKQRAEIINDKNSKTTIVSYKANEITINTVANKHSTLILRDVYYPGWKAIVNGEETNIKPYKVFRSVLVPAGTSNVKMYYQPLSFIVAGIISIISWIIITIYLLFSFFKNQKQIRAKLHISKSKVKK